MSDSHSLLSFLGHVIRVELVSVGTGENGTSWLGEVNMVAIHMVGLGSHGSDDAIWGLGCDHVGDIADALIVQVQIAKVLLTCVDQDAQKLKNCDITLTFSQSAHRWLNKVEFLLEIVEADLSIDAVPVEHAVFNKCRGAQPAIDVLLIQDIKHRLEQSYKNTQHTCY